MSVHTMSLRKDTNKPPLVFLPLFDPLTHDPGSLSGRSHDSLFIHFQLAPASWPLFHLFPLSGIFFPQMFPWLAGFSCRSGLS